MMESLAYRLFGQGDFGRLAHWLVSLPAEVMTARPRLRLVSAWLLLFDNQVERAEEMVAHIAQQVEAYQQPMVGPEWAELLSSMAMFSATLALRRNNHEQAIALVGQTLQWRSSEAASLRQVMSPHLGIILGMAYRARGDLASAERALLEASQEDDYFFFDLVALHDLSELYEAQGHLRKLGHVYKQILKTLERLTSQQPWLKALIYASYANLLCVVMTGGSCQPTLEAWNETRPL
jgi:ATP/maltotriose-dependent transcriptional regulator MalT